MSELYVKWKALNKSSHSMKSYQKKLIRINDNLNGIKKSLEMSPNISGVIISNLNSDIQNIETLCVNLSEFSEALLSVSEIYQSVEEKLINEE